MSDDVQPAGKGFMPSALLVAAVGAILFAGLILKSAPSADAVRPIETVPVAPPALGSSIAPELAAPVEDPEGEAFVLPPPPEDPPAEDEADPVLTRLATRAAADRGRLAKTRARFTAQLLVACKGETVERLLAASAGSSKLYVLPAQVRDNACFRVCYGSYASAKEAAAAADLPKSLRGTERIGAVEIAKVIP